MSLEFQPDSREELDSFVQFLLKHLLVCHRKRDDSAQTLYLLPSPNARIKAFAPPDKSWIKLSYKGGAEVFVTPEDYGFLEVPISYHLLCEKLVGRLRESYQLFAEGDEKAALEVFRVEDREKEAPGGKP